MAPMAQGLHYTRSMNLDAIETEGRLIAAKFATMGSTWKVVAQVIQNQYGSNPFALVAATNGARMVWTKGGK